MHRTTAWLVAVALAGITMALDGWAWTGARNPSDVGESLAVSRVFDAEGGTLTATGVDGTQYILTVPADATALPLEITMTPSASRRPGDRRKTEVRIDPEGAFLWQPAELRILPPTTPDLKTLRTFRVGGPDASFTFYPGIPGSTEIAMEISYLATYGVVTDGTPGMSPQRHVRTGPAGLRPPGFRNKLSASLAPYIAQEADIYKQAADRDLAFDTYILDVYRLWGDAWSDVVFPALNSLGGECDLGHLTSVFQLAFEFLSLDPREDPSRDLYGTSLYEIVKDRLLGCIDVFYELCKSRNDPAQVLLIMQAERQLSLVGLLSAQEIVDIHEKIGRCLQFEVDFESALTVGTSIGGGSHGFHMKVRAIVPLALEYVLFGTPKGDRLKPVLRGSADIVYTQVDVTGSPCTYAPTTTKPDTFSVYFLDLMMFQDNASGESIGVPRDEIKIDMNYFTGYPEFAYEQRCPAGSAGIVTVAYPSQPMFTTFYGFLHQDEALQDGHYRVVGPAPHSEAQSASFPPEGSTPTPSQAPHYWQLIRSGNFFAKAEYVRTVPLPGLGPIPEETTIFLKHTPQ